MFLFKLYCENILGIWNYTLNIGTESIKDSLVLKKIKLTNFITSILILVSFPFSIYFYSLGFVYQGIFVFVADLGFAFSFYLNSIKKYTFAKLWLILLANLACFPYAVYFGKASGIPYTYLPFSCLPLLVYRASRFNYALLCSLLSILLFLSVQYTLPNFHVHKISLPVLDSIYLPMILLVFAITLSSTFYLAYESELAEKTLRKSKEKFELEIAEARHVIENTKFNHSDNTIAEILKSQIHELQINEEQLKKSNETLKRTNIDLDNFIYTASHDLKSPISNIEGLIDAMYSFDQNKSLEIKEILNMMSISVARFKNTITELTEITKIQKDVENEFVEINIESLFNEVIFSINDFIKLSDAIIIADFSCCPYVKFSKRNLRSLFYNLISNAVKYKAPNRRPIVEVRTDKLPNSDYIILSIKDNGLGIAEEHRTKIFSMFKRVHTHVEGSGVGLYIVKRILDNTGGKIELVSEVGIGSDFQIFLKEDCCTT